MGKLDGNGNQIPDGWTREESESASWAQWSDEDIERNRLELAELVREEQRLWRVGIALWREAVIHRVAVMSVAPRIARINRSARPGRARRAPRRSCRRVARAGPSTDGPVPERAASAGGAS